MPTVASTRTELAQLMTPQDANVLGKVFGGAILSMIDLTASACAQKYSGRVCVTASFDRVDFHEPIELGNLVTTVAHVAFVGRTSLEVVIDVYATDLTKGIERHTNTARVTMVALGEDGRPTPVPSLDCETREDKERFLEGKLRRELRQRRIQELERYRARIAEVNEAGLDALLASERVLTQLEPSG